MNIEVLAQPSGSDDPMAGFGSVETMLGKVYLLQVKTGSGALDNALYSIAHPTQPDADPNATHSDVVAALRWIVKIYPEYAEIATELAKAYEKEYCDV